MCDRGSAAGKRLKGLLKSQALAAYKGQRTARNEASILMEDYLTRRALSKIGYVFGHKELSQFEMAYLTLIDSEISKHESRDYKKNSKMKRKG